MFGKGISKEGDILDLAANVGIISKSGAWYAYEGDKIGQGRENAKTYLRENPEFCKMIEEWCVNIILHRRMRLRKAKRRLRYLQMRKARMNKIWLQ